MRDSDKTPNKATAKRRKSRANTRSVTHGITSTSPVILGVEEPRDWDAHLEGIRESLDPEGRLEGELARRIALSLWQLNRVDRHITAVTAAYIESTETSPMDFIPIPYGLGDIARPIVEAKFGEAGQAERTGGSSKPVEDGPRTREERLIPQKSDLKKIIRYEAHLHRLVDRNLRILEALQSRRLGRPINLHRHL